MDEKTLDIQTSEYYSFGESTWDLVIFIGTGALGPLGSLQTFLLAIINVLMQVVFCAIAYYNFTTPDINEDSIVDTLRQGFGADVPNLPRGVCFLNGKLVTLPTLCFSV
jgi:hypothetical protein